ncbi:hypothetical protein BDZ94DRAFT_1266941 [Collybia nuda]|uniref:Uncharacterized protein n=1 Tax=Collybia nuda TaxID=64659 RepID=A0A9P6CGK4_9AGAR|nr:hypothetical protein BDZ94DRAFT_1266941 [Collybia nuda]
MQRRGTIKYPTPFRNLWKRMEEHTKYCRNHTLPVGAPAQWECRCYSKPKKICGALLEQRWLFPWIFILLAVNSRSICVYAQKTRKYLLQNVLNGCPSSLEKVSKICQISIR